MIATVQSWRIGTVLAITGLVLSFVLAWLLHDATPFSVTAPVAVGGKWFESYAQRKHGRGEPSE